MKKILTFLLLLGFAQADDETARVVYDLTTKNLAKFEKSILKSVAVNKSLYEGEFKELEVAVIIHGGAFRFFVKDVEKTVFKTDVALVKAYGDLKKRIATMADTYEVEFLMCAASMGKYKLEKKDIMPFVKYVATSTKGVIDKQNEGYAYMKIED
ncbi:DsrE family protein [Sulfurimonas sp. MAG313]|nr:DsrE family protein [Sulfurimonas sp. MAG313]MDF1880712.1 DsrE family protein [Sulfurimonas sp. MAG313]